MIKSGCFLFIGLLCMVGEGVAYEVETHAALTGKAYQQSFLVQDAQFMGELGVDPDRVLSTEYYDIGDSGIGGMQIWQRQGQEFSEDKVGVIKKIVLAAPNTPLGWLMRGSIREDDTPDNDTFDPLCTYTGGFPEDDPFGNITRVFHHFYDPTTGKPLTVALLPWGEPAPKWGSGRDDAFDVNSPLDAGRRNHFSLADAREAMFRALTLQATDGSTAIVPVGNGNTQVRCL